MIFDEEWKDTLFLSIVITVFGIIAIIQLLRLYAKRLYRKWWNNPSTPLDVDAFVDTPENPPKYLKIAFLQHMSTGIHRQPSNEIVKLASVESPHVPGLQVTQRAEPRAGGKGGKDFVKGTQVNDDDSSSKPVPIVVGTIRMGFGHHRIAYAASSWSLNADQDNNGTTTSTPRTTYFHDLLNIDSPEADLIKSTDAVYSKMSRFTSNMGGVVERLWGKLMTNGDGDALRISGLTAVHLRPLFRDLDKRTPIVATHCYVALAAVAAGFENVINLVIDNHAQWFVVVPKALNLVQGPVNYANFLKMGVDPSNIRLAGHWIPRDLVLNIPTDCQGRITRNGNKKPVRILIPVGGAGAQRNFIVKFVKALKPFVHDGSVQLFLNAGDHTHMKEAFVSALSSIGLSSDSNDNNKHYDIVSTTQGVTDFQKRLLKGLEPATNVTLFSFDDYFPAVATTDVLCRVTDVLACKPSELAFYPVPKLMIRRVGDHEAYSALRAAELGDGTLEAREIEDAMAYVNLFVNGKDGGLLKSMNESIVRNAKIGVYDGCKNAIKIALDWAKELEKNR